MLALLRTRRWVGFTLLVLVAVVAFGFLSRWQWQRAEQKRLDGLAVVAAAHAPGIDVTALTESVAEWQSVSALGTYEAANEVVVRQRPQGGHNGFWVLTPLRMLSGRVCWVNRGWIAAGSSALATPALPAPPSGVVKVTGSWHPFEQVADAARTGLPAGMVGAVDASVLPLASDVPGYLRLATSDPSQTGLDPLPPPESDNSRNLSYAGQWLLFAAVALVGWFVFLRREAKSGS